MHTPLADTIGCKRNRDRGAILMVVLIVMVALLGLGMTGLFLTSGSIQMNSNINLRNQALVVAEAGIERGQAILNNPALSPNMPALLNPAVSNPADEPISSTNECQGERRGSILRENGTALVDIAYPTVSRTSDLPGTGSTSGSSMVVSSTMGKYTVYLRQDTRDCRMGNYTCDIAPGIDGGVEACATPPPVGVPPNGAVVLRSEGVASDGRTRVVLEVTMSPSHGVSLGGGTPLSALCASGANGCDDNASVQSGIVVTSPSPSQGGASGSGAGGAAGSGGAGGGGAGGGATGTLPGAGGASGGGAGGGGAGGGGAGGTGSGGTGTCTSAYCARIATMGVWGLFNYNVVDSSNDSGSSKFRNWLDTHNAGCNPVGSIMDWGGSNGYYLTDADLEPYSVIIMLDMFHTNKERWACLRNWNNKTPAFGDTSPSATRCCGGQYCYNPATNKCNGGASAQPVVSFWSPVAFTSPSYPSGYNSSVADMSGCASASETSYKKGTQPLLTSTELDVIERWVRKGGGLVVTSGYYMNAPETANYNAILRRFNLQLDTYNAAGNKPLILTGYNSQGVDVCGNGASGCTGNDFVAGSPIFDNFKTVYRLNVMGAGVLSKLATPYVSPTFSPAAPTPDVAARVYCERAQTVAFPAVGTCSHRAIASCLPTDGSKGYSYPNNNGSPSTNYRKPTWDIAYTVDNVGTGGGRVVAWADEWMTYDTSWNTDAACVASGTPNDYDGAEFWENVVKWLGKCSL
jgi:hypothetical protein